MLDFLNHCIYSTFVFSCGDPIEKSPCVAEARLKSPATPTIYKGYKKLKQMPVWLQKQTICPISVPLLER